MDPVRKLPETKQNNLKQTFVSRQVGELGQTLMAMVKNKKNAHQAKRQLTLQGFGCRGRIQHRQAPVTVHQSFAANFHYDGQIHYSDTISKLP